MLDPEKFTQREWCDLAYAAGHDEAARRMRKAGRERWNREDYNAGAVVTNKMLRLRAPWKDWPED